MVNGRKIWVSVEHHNSLKGTPQYFGYVNADCFIICVACNDQASFDSIDKWSAEIKKNSRPDKPIFLILTKTDLSDEEKVVTLEQLIEKSESGGFQGAFATSAKLCEDFNVLKAFNHVMSVSHVMKYEEI